jgi:TRAP-type C4-dicarboxylate transport system substrate-binding protein
MKRFCALFVLICSLFVFVRVADAADIKFAIVAPEGSTWAKVVNDWNKELKERTNGAVSFKIYAGGVQGDERDVIRKMRVGQLDMAGLTGLGLGIINSEVRILELPFLFRNYQEVDAVTRSIQPKLEDGFRRKGFELLGWAEAGFVNIFSNKPIAKLEDLEGVKMWMWEADPLVKSMCAVLDIVPIPLALTDVLTSLQTNLIDAAYAPPLGAIALQWFTRTKYFTTDKLSNSTGAFVITKRALNKLTPAQTKVLKETARKYSKILVDRTRKENEESYAALKKAGLTPVELDKAQIGDLYKKSEQVWADLTDKLYPATLLAQVKATLAKQRSE